MKECTVKLVWSEGVWYSQTVDESFGVTLESGSLDALVERVKIAVQDILAVDYQYTGDIRFRFLAERTDNMKSDKATA